MKCRYLNDGFFSQLETLAIELRANLSGFFGGKHLVKTYGQTVEFADYREYALGDDIRRIDWNLYSRFEKFFLKLFTDERQMHTQIFLDYSASMGKNDPEKAEYAIAVAAALGYLSVHNMDKVSFKLMRGNACDDKRGVIVGKRAFFDAVGELENLEFDGETSIDGSILSCTDLGSSDGLAVIISDFFSETDWKKAIDYLSFKKKQILLVQILTREEIDPSYTGRVHLVDSETLSIEDERNMKIKIDRSNLLAYEQALKFQQDELRTYCHSRGADFISICTDQPVEKVLFKELLKVGIIE